MLLRRLWGLNCSSLRHGLLIVMSVRLVEGKDLFSKKSLRDYLNRQQERVGETIRDISRDRVLQVPTSTLANEVYEECCIDVPTLPEDQQLQERVQISGPTDVEVDVSENRSRAIRGRSTPTHVEGTRINFEVYFAGDYRLFQCEPKTYSKTPPRASCVASDALVFAYEWPNDTGSVRDAHEQFQGEVREVRNTIETVQEQVEDGFNDSLRQTIEPQLKRRRESVSEDRSAVESLPYDLKRRSNAPNTYKAPVEQTFTKPKPEERNSGQASNWIIEDEVYEDILTVLRNMAWVMERSPSAFEEMNEEDLRAHFLVQLNGQFTGPSTGETFNRTGKTDIYLPVKDRAVFIAECKFWRGQRAFGEAIDQLLSYSSWRDTKTALVLFNRNQDTSQVLAQIPETVGDREDHLRTTEYGEETDFRFVLHHGDDPGREITITVLVFDVPTS